VQSQHAQSATKAIERKQNGEEEQEEEDDGGSNGEPPTKKHKTTVSQSFQSIFLSIFSSHLGD
jgi:hypothetical protein